MISDTKASKNTQKPLFSRLLAFGTSMPQVRILSLRPYRVFITKVMNTRYFFAYSFLFGAGFLLFSFVMLWWADLSALKGDLSLSVPFGDLQTADKAIMDDHALCAVLSRTLNLMNFNFLYQLTKNHGIKRFHLHKTPYRLDKALLGLALLRKAIKFFA